MYLYCITTNYRCSQGVYINSILWRLKVILYTATVQFTIVFYLRERLDFREGTNKKKKIGFSGQYKKIGVLQLFFYTTSMEILSIHNFIKKNDFYVSIRKLGIFYASIQIKKHYFFCSQVYFFCSQVSRLCPQNRLFLLTPSLSKYCEQLLEQNSRLDCRHLCAADFIAVFLKPNNVHIQYTYTYTYTYVYIIHILLVYSISLGSLITQLKTLHPFLKIYLLKRTAKI